MRSGRQGSPGGETTAETGKPAHCLNPGSWTYLQSAGCPGGWPVLERGPVDDTLTVLVWRDEQERVLAVGLHFACHGVAVCEQSIGSDIPGNLARRIGEMFGGPCLYLQGAAGDVNPVTVAGSRPAMLAWVERCMDHVQSLSQALRPVPCTPLRAVSVEVPLAYKALPQRAVTERNIVNLDRIAQGDVTSPDVQDTLQLLAGIMNFRPGERPDPDKAAFAAWALANAERRTLEAGETITGGRRPRSFAEHSCCGQPSPPLSTSGCCGESATARGSRAEQALSWRTSRYWPQDGPATGTRLEERRVGLHPLAQGICFLSQHLVLKYLGIQQY